MFQIIPHDINVDFMGARRRFFTFSGILLLASLVTLTVKGFDMGIDFAGGSSAIVAFEDGSVDDHGEIETSVQALVTATLNRPGTVVTAQGFGAGAGDTLDGRPVDRLIIYTEVTSVVDEAKRASVIQKIKAAFGEEARVATSEDAGDTFYIVFPADADIAARRGELQKVFAEIGFQKTTIVSELERTIEVEFLRDLELLKQDVEREGSAGGTEVPSAAMPTVADLQGRLAKAVEGKTDRRFTVDVQAFQAALEGHLATHFSGRFIKVESAATVSPSVGGELFSDGMLAMLYSIIGILIYILLRFDVRYAPGAVISLAHDAIITMGFVSAFDIKFSLVVVAAILTIIGYSINDKIIVYDRVRETAAGQQGRDLLSLLNKAVNNTLSRTVFTSGTTVFSCIALMLFGGGNIFEFGLVMFFGVVLGTYSSICIAVPFISYIDSYMQRREADKKSAGGGGPPSKKKGPSSPGDDKKARASA